MSEQDQIEQLKAEIERLRAALRQTGEWIHANGEDESILGIIDAALSGKEET